MNRLILYVLLLLLLLANFVANAQKILQMEKYGSLKNKRYYIGDQITYQLKGDPGNWREDEIIDLNAANKLIYFSKGAINLSDITMMRPNNIKEKGKFWSRKLYLFGASWSFWSVVTLLRGIPFSWNLAIVPAAAVVIGFGVEMIIRHKKYKMGNRHWLRILDLNMQPRA